MIPAIGTENVYRKAAQALAFFAHKKDGRINKMKAIKLIYLADRLHLRKYGRPIVGDTYWAMKLGPVGSYAKRAAELDLPDAALGYVKKYIHPIDAKKRVLGLLRTVDLDVFSATEIECLERTFEVYGDRDQFELAELTHVYPEWKKHERKIDSSKKRILMKYEDFFAEADKKDPLFVQDKAQLEYAKESFEESEEVSEFFAK